MDNQLGGDEDRKRNEQSGMHFNVVQEDRRLTLSAQVPTVVRINSGSQANSGIMSSRRYKSCK